MALADFNLGTRLATGPGSVYLATPPARLGRTDGAVVIHALRPIDPQSWDRLRHRLETLAPIRSGHLEQLIEAGYEPGSDPPAAWYVTEDHGRAELIEGRDLPAVLAAVAGASRGVHALHEGGITHDGISVRTVHPVAGGGIIDLPAFTPSTCAVGRFLEVRSPVELDTIEPAVARGEPPSRASDIWALAAVLHHVASGRLLHPALAGDEIFVALQRVAFEPIQLSPDLDAGLGELIASSLARDPGERPATAEVFADRLDNLVTGK